ncbi:MAG: hypothetical protein DRN49_05350 [Thaumarchaeota archaeon]|nr:MAG: hypothetical protein DRN49_05350 [Nitrososphaerota archaeon]
MLVKELVNEVRKRAKGKRIEKVAIGISYVGVVNELNGMGVAFVFRDQLGYHCEVSEYAGEMPKEAEKLLDLALSSNPLDSSVGIATINSFCKPEKYEKGDLLDLLDVRRGDVVGMVGYFGPFIKRLKDRVKEIYVFEKGVFDVPFVYPDWAAELLLPKVDVAIITGTSVINKTIDHLLDLASNARSIAVVSPSTPLIAEPFFKRGVNILSGVLVKDVNLAFKIIVEGGGTIKLNKAVEKVNIVRD